MDLSHSVPFVTNGEISNSRKSVLTRSKRFREKWLGWNRAVCGPGSTLRQQSNKIACTALTLRAARSVLEVSGARCFHGAALFPRSVWIAEVYFFAGAFVSVPLWGGE